MLPGGERPASVHIEDGRIVSIGGEDETPPGAEIVECGDLVVSPGIVDSHVHVNEPGRTEWEGFDTATRAAAAGGVTTIVDMPLNSVPATTTVAALEAKRRAARGRCHVDVAFWGGIVPGNEADVEPLIDAGVRGFKCFLVPSGVDEFPPVGERTLRQAMPVLARPGCSAAGSRRAARAPARRIEAARRVIAITRRPRPVEAERAAIDLMATLARETGARVHIVHVSSAAGADDDRGRARRRRADHRRDVSALPDVGERRDSGRRDRVQVRAADSERERSRGAVACPGIGRARSRGDRSFAGAAVDEMPGRLRPAWGGIASLELSLAAVWTRAFERGRTPADLAAWMSAAPAALAGLSGRKGRIAPGLRRRPRGLGRRSRVHGRRRAAAAAPQAHAVCGTPPARRRAHDVPAGRARVGSRPSRRIRLGGRCCERRFVDLVDLASERLGGRVVAANDEFFAPKERLILAEAPIWRDGEYTDRGKWMDGWETRRRRDVLPGEANSIGRTTGASSGSARAGSYAASTSRRRISRATFRSRARSTPAWRPARRPQPISIACRGEARSSVAALRGDSHNLFDVAARRRDTRAPADLPGRRRRAAARVRRRDPGLGRASPAGRGRSRRRSCTVRASSRAATCSSGGATTSSCPGPRAAWPTAGRRRRRRTPGHDWAVVRLGARGTITRVEVDTRHFKGNAPGGVQPRARARRRRRERRLAGAVAANAAAGRFPPRLRHDTDDRLPASRTCASTSFRTAAWRGCACSAGPNDARAS